MEQGRLPGRIERAHLYRLRLEGTLEPKWSDWFDGLELYVEGGETVLSGWLPDQPALYGLLDRARDLGLTLIALERLQ